MAKRIPVSFMLELPDDQAKLLDDILSQRHSLKLADVCTAAAEEYAQMIIGERAFSRGSEFQEYRLFLLTKYAFDTLLPTESTVCALFQLTPTRARSLIQAVAAKYQYELREIVNATLKRVLEPAKADAKSDFLTFFVDSNVYVTLLKERIRALGGDRTQISKTEKVGEYKILPSVRDELLKAL
jgi:hypothetical protein